MKEFWMREDESKIAEIKEVLKDEGEVEVITEYETLYGVGWYRWLISHFSEPKYEFHIKGYNKWYGYPDRVIITDKTKRVVLYEKE